MPRLKSHDVVMHHFHFFNQSISLEQITNRLQHHFAGKMDQIIDLNETFYQRASISHIALAVSGGSDSMALLSLASSYVKNKSLKLTVLTVDHRLRPEAAAEAQFVKDYCTKLKINHDTLTLDEFEKHPPVKAIQEKARDARYEKLERKCAQIHASLLLLGQHFDDQLETFIMREKRKSDLYGLAVMPLMRATRDILIARPMLDVSKNQILQYCDSMSIPYITDPSNENLTFERIRIRKTLSKEWLSQKNRIVPMMKQAISVREKMDKSLFNFIDQHVSISQYPCLKVSISAFLDLEPDIAMRLLPKLTEMIQGRFSFFKKIKKENFYNKLKEISAKGSGFIVFGGCEFAIAPLKKEGNALYIYSEAGTPDSQMAHAQDGRSYEIIKGSSILTRAWMNKTICESALKALPAYVSISRFRKGLSVVIDQGDVIGIPELFLWRSKNGLLDHCQNPPIKFAFSPEKVLLKMKFMDL
ncbi:MAG: tRNA lysidine(34) synthetase TilS [Alphaproteobacteria bacterium]|nr:tRNA lysidine(34) synthetase TilS [Alphaproteobacteria bacterium]